MHPLENMMDDRLPPAVKAFAAADFASLAERFARIGYATRMPARGILQLTPPGDASHQPWLLVSAGIHGDETAPIELLAHLLDRLAGQPGALRLNLMVVLGNPDAVAIGKRFVDTDLNRLFGTRKSSVQPGIEARRADDIMRATAEFFMQAKDAEKWHVDLHTAIRPSRYPTFAVVPDVLTDERRQLLLGWLGQAAIDAAIFNRHPADTFSAYTATACGGVSATLELGQIGALGSNDPERFGTVRDALDALMRQGRMTPGTRMPLVFTVAQELLKHSDDFRMIGFDRTTSNFTALPPGAVIAEDGEHVYRVGPQTEYVVFPNPDVQIGLRAGLMVVRSA